MVCHLLSLLVGCASFDAYPSRSKKETNATHLHIALPNEQRARFDQTTSGPRAITMGSGEAGWTAALLRHTQRDRPPFQTRSIKYGSVVDLDGIFLPLSLTMSVSIAGAFRLLASTASWSSRTRTLALRYYAHLASCNDSSDSLTVNVFLPPVTDGSPPAERSWIKARGFLFEGTRCAGADVEVADYLPMDPQTPDQSDNEHCIISVTGKLHKKWLFHHPCALVEVNKHDGLWYIG